MFFVYILLRSDGKYYVGQTNDVQQRLLRHRSGQVQSTKAHLPVQLVYTEQFATRQQSMRREKYLKSLKSHSALKTLISTYGPVV